MESGYDLIDRYTNEFNKLFQILKLMDQNLNHENLIQHRREINQYQKLIDEHSKNLHNIWNSILSPNIDQEVTRYNTISKIINCAQYDLNFRQKYEVHNIIERWLISLANHPESNDVIFSINKLKLDYPSTMKMKNEMLENRIPNTQERVNMILQHAYNFLELQVYPKSNPPILLDSDIIQINDYIRKLPPGKIKILLQMNPSLDLLGIMIMRYACILPGSQQWSIPFEIYNFMTERYQVTVEGFASPINSQILYVSTKFNYCSLFPDTDSIYGSLGDFFKVDLIGKHVYLNPPFILSIMDQMSKRVIEQCESAKLADLTVRFFITVPEWTDTEYYETLSNSPFLVANYELSKGKHYYINTNQGSEKIKARFGTRIFVLAHGIDDRYSELNNFLKKIFS